MISANICRLCLYDGEDVIFVLNNESIINKIKECVSVEITEKDNLPTTACRLCIQKVEEWSNFKKSCLKATKVLLELNLKKEEPASEKSHKTPPDDEQENVKNSSHDTNLKNNTVENVYECEICSKEFRNFLEYLDHQPVHNGEAVFKCDKCPEVFTSRQDLVGHDRNHKRPCPHCGKMILRSSMKLHLIKHTDRHMCPQCCSRFNSRAALQQHTITIHTKQKDHICEACGKRFSSKTSMNVHLKSHSDERMYRCKLCDYAGRTASAVYVHMSTHAQEVCICQMCSKTFKSNRNLNDHIRRVHSKEKKHRCTYCDKKFVDKYMLTVHVRCHTGVRPYSCRICDKAFIRSDGLKEHMAIHGDRVWYKCEKCVRKFASKKGIARHNCGGVII